jgi:hypothetical protein
LRIPAHGCAATNSTAKSSGCFDHLVTVTFEESNGITLVTLHQLFPSKEALDGAVASGMERGMQETFDQLGTLVASLQR